MSVPGGQEGFSWHQAEKREDVILDHLRCHINTHHSMYVVGDREISEGR